jgi:hypothetical protein
MSQTWSPPFRPRPGDVVAYRGYLYFYQPNGTFCYLYHNSEDLGCTKKKALKAHYSSVTQPSAHEKSMFLAADRARIDAKPKVYHPHPIMPPIIDDYDEGTIVNGYMTINYHDTSDDPSLYTIPEDSDDEFTPVFHGPG